MTISLGSFGFKTQFHVRYRALLIPWVKNNSGITCLKSRDYNSSVPIRYIPKKSSNNNENGSSEQIKKGAKSKEFCEFSEASIPFDKVVVSRNHGGNGNGKVLQKRNNFDLKPRFEHRPLPSYKFLANEFEQDSLVEEPEEVYEEFFIDRKKSSDHDDSPEKNRTKLDAEKMVVKLLAMRAFTAVELRKKLCGKKFSPGIVDEVINDYKCRGFINDSLYAEGFCQSRWSSSSWGPQRIKQALYRKGVSKDDAEKAIQLVFESGESDSSDGYKEPRHGLSEPSMDRLFVQASKQWLRGHDVPKEKRKARIIRWLQYRGFSWDVISTVVKKLESNDPS